MTNSVLLQRIVIGVVILLLVAFLISLTGLNLSSG